MQQREAGAARGRAAARGPHFCVLKLFVEGRRRGDAQAERCHCVLPFRVVVPVILVLLGSRCCECLQKRVVTFVVVTAVVISVFEHLREVEQVLKLPGVVRGQLLKQCHQTGNHVPHGRLRRHGLWRWPWLRLRRRPWCLRRPPPRAAAFAFASSCPAR